MKKKAIMFYHGLLVIYQVSKTTQLRTIASLKSFPDIETDA